MSIQFGTDGWRAKVGEDFTVENVKLCTQAVCNYLKSREIADNGLMVGYDTRVGSADFAVAVSEVAAGNSIPVTLCDRPAPTPVVSYNLVRRDCAAGVIITASHNPSDWNGFKFKPGYGGSASQEIITELETCLDSVLEDQGYLSLPITDAEKDSIRRTMESIEGTSVPSQTLRSRDTADGTRFVFESGAWVVARMSGTEPLLRVYAEGPSQAVADDLVSWLRTSLGV